MQDRILINQRLSGFSKLSTILTMFLPLDKGAVELEKPLDHYSLIFSVKDRSDRNTSIKSEYEVNMMLEGSRLMNIELTRKSLKTVHSLVLSVVLREQEPVVITEEDKQAVKVLKLFDFSVLEPEKEIEIEKEPATLADIKKLLGLLGIKNL